MAPQSVPQTPARPVRSLRRTLAPLIAGVACTAAVFGVVAMKNDGSAPVLDATPPTVRGSSFI